MTGLALRQETAVERVPEPRERLEGLCDPGSFAPLRTEARSPHLDGLELMTLTGNPVAEGWLAEPIRRKFGGRVRM